jgi:hypothetical protein
MLANLALENTVMANNFTKAMFDSLTFRDSGSRRSPVAASAAEDDIMVAVVVVVVVVKVVEWFEFGDGRGHSSSDGICL